MLVPALLGAAGAAAAGIAWGLFESQAPRLRTVEVPVPGLPAGLQGIRLLHLSDFHLGSFSLSHRSLRKAARWAADRDVDLALITGDLLSRPRGERVLRSELDRLRPRCGTFAVLGNHDVAITRDPFSARSELRDLQANGVELLRDGARVVSVRGERVQVVGCDPLSYLRRSFRPEAVADPTCGLRILLSHYPRVVDRLLGGAYHLVLAGHLHGGQICLPSPRGKVRLAHVRARYTEGVFDLGSTTLVVSRGLGTTFLPFRFFARPEAVELVLRGQG